MSNKPSIATNQAPYSSCVHSRRGASPMSSESPEVRSSKFSVR
jgi:hypothetical protein